LRWFGANAGDRANPDEPEPDESEREEAEPDQTEPARPRAGEEVEADLKPSAMRRPEPLYGFIVFVELVIIAVINLTVTTGKGAPAHPQTTTSIIGLAGAFGFGAVLLTRHRMYVSFAAIGAAFFVTLPRVPDRVTIYHLFGLVFPLVFAFLLTQRQRKAQAALTKNRPKGSGPGRTASDRRTAGQPERRGRRAKTPEPTGPAANRRYTPPKPKRPGRR
jgi:hypothetical protein